MRIKSYGIKIIGNEEFCEQTKQALDLLKDKDSHNFRKVRKFLRFIVQHRVTLGTSPEHKAFLVGTKTAFLDPKDELFSLIWYASCIVHDAIHVELFRRFNRKDEKEIEKWELLCCRFQERCLKKIGGTSRHFAYLEASIKSKYWEGERKY